VAWWLLLGLDGGFNGAVAGWFLGGLWRYIGHGGSAWEARSGGFMVEVKWLLGACGHGGVTWCSCRYKLQQGKWLGGRTAYIWWLGVCMVVRR